MKLKFYFSLILLMCCCFVNGQSKDIILTQAQNNSWFDTLGTLPENKQFDFIKKRILSDTIIYCNNIFWTEQLTHSGNDSSRKPINYGDLAEGRIVYCIRTSPTLFKDGNFLEFLWTKNTECEEILKFYKLLTTSKIKLIEITKYEETKTRLMGTLPGFGSITFELESNRDFKKFLKLIYEFQYHKR